MSAKERLATTTEQHRQSGEEIPLSRQMGPVLLTLYGLGTTIGAGIYALLGDIAQVANSFAPWSFLLASVLAGITACSFAELSSRFPRAGATPFYVQQGFASQGAAVVIGLLLVGAAMTSSAALLNGLVGYVQGFVDTSRIVIVSVTLLLSASVAVWGIKQSAWVAAIVTLLEAGGLLWMVGLAGQEVMLQPVSWDAITPDFSQPAMLFAGAVLAFYAYIGFEDMVEVAEEVKQVQKNLPRAILATLVITTVLYLLLMSTVMLATSVEFLANTDAPFADVYLELTGKEPTLFLLLGGIAILNGVLIQLIMASRILYGLSKRGQMPAFLSVVWAKTRTPAYATMLVAGLVLILALRGNLQGLAVLTSQIMFLVFGLANLALWRIKRRSDQPAPFNVPNWLPIVGFCSCLGVMLWKLLVG